MDWELVVLVVVILALVAGFVYRRTRSEIFRLAWLVLIWVETQVRKLAAREEAKK